jgi:steroid delta-isomerase-like uncharacterized protein
MEQDEMKAVARRFFEEVWNQGKLEVIDEIYAKDCSLNGRLMGSAGIKQFIGMFRTGFPDIHLSIEEQAVDGNRLVTRTRSQGTHQGKFMGMPATDKRIDIGAITISRFIDGIIVEEWEYNDGLGLYRQIGVIPSRGKG